MSDSEEENSVLSVSVLQMLHRGALSILKDRNDLLSMGRQWDSNNDISNSEQLCHHSQARVRKDIYHMVLRENAEII